MAVTIDGVGEINGVVLPTTGFGKVLQVVRATDTTSRSTTSTSFVDVTGMSVTITPQKSTSAVIILSAFHLEPRCDANGNSAGGKVQITDSANNAISGTESLEYANAATATSGQTLRCPITIVAYATPATTSPVTYKLRFSTTGANRTVFINNDDATGQMYAIEVSA